MLRLAEADGCPIEGSQIDGAAAAVPAATAMPAGAAPFERGGRYGAERRFRPGSVIAVLVAHLAAFGLGMYLQPHFHKAERHRLKMVEVRLDTPPPPEQPKQKQAEAVKLEIQPYNPPPPIPLVSAATVPVDPAPPPMIMAPPAPPAPPAAPAPPAVVQGGDIGTQMISAKPPRYPIEARRKRQQGTVVLAITLGLDGRVANIAIARSSGFASLDDAARDAVRRWRWAPTIRDGAPVMVRGVVEIPFVLQG